MHFKRFGISALGLSVLSAAVVSSFAAGPSPPPPPPPVPQAAPPQPPAPPPVPTPVTAQFEIRTIAAPNAQAPPPGGPPAGTVQFQAIGPMQFNVPVAAPEMGKFWLGVMCAPASDVLRSQLALPAGTGLVVEEVVPEGPAAKAGIERNDLLLSVNMTPLSDLAVLGKAVNDKGGKPIELTTMRAGKKKAVKVTPAERPAANAVFVATAVQSGAPLQAVTEWTEQLRKQAAEGPRMEPGRPLRMMILHPGRIIQAAIPEKPFPADLSVTITREGNKPVKFSVKQGDKSWELGADELKKLPETVRPFVQGYMQRLGMADVLREVRPVPPGAAAAAAGAPIEIQIEATADVNADPPIPVPSGGTLILGTAGKAGTITATAQAGSSSSSSSAASSSGASSTDRDQDLKEMRQQLRALQERLDRVDGKTEK